MSRPFRRLRQFFAELKRRKVYRVAAGYLVAAFVVLQLADLAAGAFGFPGWFQPMVWVFAGLGFPIALVLAWAFEVTPEGVRRTPEAKPAEQGASGAGQRLSTAYKVLVGLGLVAAAVAGGWYLTGGGGQTPQVTEGTVAVLPFEVSGSGTDTWRDGMVTYLTPGLDGAGGLRAIPDRTVFAAWAERAQPNEGASAAEALSVAREVGAQYAVIGSAGGLGSEVRFAVEVYETTSAERIGQVEVRGSPDSVPALADSLTRRVLGVMLGQNSANLPSVDLGRMTTRSLPALKAYLNGERHFRAGEYDAAIEDYEQAVERDTTFALAYARLASSHGWLTELDRARSYARRASELAARLPERERRVLSVVYRRDVENRPWAAIDSLERLTEAYPDDPSIWYELGEAFLHHWVPVHWEKVDEAFRQAVELDPGLAGYHHHLVDLALWYHRDSARAARRISAHPGQQHRNVYRAAFDLVFDTPEDRQAAVNRLAAALRSIVPSGGLPWVWTGGWPIAHPEDLGLQERLIRALHEGSDPGTYRGALARNHLQRGQIAAALPLIREVADIGTPVASCLVARAVALGYPLPDSVADPLLAPAHIEEDVPLHQLRCSGYYLIERGRSEELSQVASRIRDRMTGEDGTPESDRELLQSTLDELRAYRAWKDGDPERAKRLLGRPRRASLWGLAPSIGVLWWGDLERRLGQFDTAEGWYMRGWSHPLAHQRLGQLYEEMDEPDKAAAAYRRFIAAWEDADPELQSRVKEARDRLQALTVAEGGDEEGEE